MYYNNFWMVSVLSMIFLTIFRTAVISHLPNLGILPDRMGDATIHHYSISRVTQDLIRERDFDETHPISPIAKCRMVNTNLRSYSPLSFILSLFSNHLDSFSCCLPLIDVIVGFFAGMHVYADRLSSVNGIKVYKEKS